MNYMINLPPQTQMQSQIPVPPGNQRAIVLSGPSQNCGNTSTSSSSSTSQQYPVVVPFGGGNQPVFVYQNSDSANNGSDNSNSNNSLRQMVITPVSPVQNGLNYHHSATSPNHCMSAVNIQSETNNNNASRSLGDLFNVQAINTMPNTGNMFPLNQGQQQNTSGNNDFAGLLSSLQAAGLQIVEQPAAKHDGPVLNSPRQLSEMKEKSAIGNFMSSLQATGIKVVENNNDNTLSISLPTSNSVDYNQVMCEGSGMPVSKQNENIIKVLDTDGKVIILNTGGAKCPDVTDGKQYECGRYNIRNLLINDIIFANHISINVHIMNVKYHIFQITGMMCLL